MLKYNAGRERDLLAVRFFLRRFRRPTFSGKTLGNRERLCAYVRLTGYADHSDTLLTPSLLPGSGQPGECFTTTPGFGPYW